MRLEKWNDFSPAFTVTGKIDVGEYPVAQPFHPPIKIDILWEVEVEGDRSHHPEDDPLLLPILDQLPRFIQESIRLWVFIQWYILGKPEFLVRLHTLLAIYVGEHKLHLHQSMINW